MVSSLTSCGLKSLEPNLSFALANNPFFSELLDEASVWLSLEELLVFSERELQATRVETDRHSKAKRQTFLHYSLIESPFIYEIIISYFLKKKHFLISKYFINTESHF